MNNKISRGSLSMVKLTVPLAMEQFFRILVSSIDTFMLSTYSEKSVAGVGLVAQYVFFLNILFSVIVTGTTIVLAQYLGAQKSDKELNYISQASSVMTTIISLVMTAVVLLGTGPLLSRYTLEPEVRQTAYDYFTIFGGINAFFIAFSLLQSGILRSYGYTKEAMYVTIMANLINVVGNAISLYGFFGMPVLGVKGVAWSSGISMIISCIVLQIIIQKKKDVQFNLHGIRNVPDQIYKVILSVGVPTAGESLSYNVAQIVVMAMISTLGTYVMSAQVYTQTIIRFAYALAISIGSATQIKTGYYVGARDSETAYHKVYKYWLCAMACSVILVGVCNVFRTPLIWIFTRKAENALVISELMIQLLLVSFYIEFGRSLNLIFIGGLKGSGDINFPVIYGLFSMWLVIVGGGWLLGLKLGLGIVGFWLAIGTEETTRGIVMFFRWRSKRWMKNALV
ncbi:MATE family efflux transporter [Treponema sp.]|uniref:MATE family efflux transporter n=1 Tax=Treponema sp. TaxID=166 RepID=UPI00298EAACA|nr:MATE family efflux transporter [Treponema sp.]MCR5614099.1 MATE family efflux transporter [Treponema sp.]